VHLAHASAVVSKAEGKPIHPNIYGHFAEHCGRGIYEGIWVGEGRKIPTIRGHRRDVVEALQRLQVPVVRWPGGCFADRYRWRDGIGPRNRRPTRVNTLYGDAIETNAFGTHEYLDLCEILSAEPYINLNVGSGTPGEAAQWIEYMTSGGVSSLTEERRVNGRVEPWLIKHLGLGNELWGCGGLMRPEHAVDVTRQFAYFAGEKILPFDSDTRINKVASGGSREHVEAMMRGGRNILDRYVFGAMSLHYYAGPVDSDGSPIDRTQATGFSESDWASTLAGALAIEEDLCETCEVMDTYDSEKSIQIFVDEWGVQHQTEPGTDPRHQFQQNSLLDAAAAAVMLHAFHRHTDRITMANLSMMVNTIHSVIFTQGENMLLTPTYHVFDLFKPFRNSTPCPIRLETPSYTSGGVTIPSLDVSVSATPSNEFVVSVVNLNPDRAIRLQTNLAGEAHGQILTGDTVDAHNTFGYPERVQPKPFIGIEMSTSSNLAFEIPGKSIVVLTVTPRAPKGGSEKAVEPKVSERDDQGARMAHA
jgi:alpha-N-arabinofuranosidase